MEYIKSDFQNNAKKVSKLTKNSIENSYKLVHTWILLFEFIDIIPSIIFFKELNLFWKVLLILMLFSFIYLVKCIFTKLIEKLLSLNNIRLSSLIYLTTIEMMTFVIIINNYFRSWTEDY